MLPNFVVIGAAKSGTTTLWSLLRQHPDIFMSEEKELRYFIERRNWGKGQAWYEDQFADVGGARAVGEVSPEYAMAHTYPQVVPRMAALIPDSKLIYLLRHPIERMASEWRDYTYAGSETLPIERALRDHPTYIRTSSYAWQLEQFLTAYPREQILVLLTDDLKADRNKTLRRIFSFLDVDPNWTAQEQSDQNTTVEKRLPRKHTERLYSSSLRTVARAAIPAPVRRTLNRRLTNSLAELPSSIPADLYDEIAAQLAPDIAQLGSWLGPDFNGWGIGPAA